LIYVEWPQEAPPPLPATPWRSMRAGAVRCALYRWPEAADHDSAAAASSVPA